MDPHLARLHRELASSIAGLSNAQLTRGLPGKWCTAEILEHLYLTYTGTIKGLSRLMAEDRSLASRATWKQRSQALVVVGLGYMPSGRKSPPAGLPRGIPPEKVTAEITNCIVEMDELLARGAARFGTRSKVLDHPVLGPLSIGQWRKFHLVHGLHHVKQIRRLLENLNRGDVPA